MDNECIRVLLIEDDQDYPQLIQVMLGQGQGVMFDLECVDTLQAGLERLTPHARRPEVNLVLLDLSLPDSQGFDTFARVYTQSPEVPIVVLSCLDDEKLAIESVHEGAQDYLVKDRVNSNLLARSIRYAIERHRTLEELKQKTLELQASEAKNRAILDAIPDLMFQISKDGVFLDYRVAKDHTSFLEKSLSKKEECGGVRPRSIAMPYGELLGRKVYEVLPVEIAQQVMDHAETALQTGAIQIFEYQLFHEGKLRDYEARIVALAGEDEVLIIVRDITERKELDRMKNRFIWRMKRARLS